LNALATPFALLKIQIAKHILYRTEVSAIFAHFFQNVVVIATPDTTQWRH